ncbi:MAG: carboxypeptidase regulatory-like domain-containing protein, partial [Candidatus Altarchaeum sp.]|nr:carboxypeptidase regulatory-like domain-containing protein [Candidatus Altarchaeum sp.]
SKSGYISNENTSATCTYTSESSNCDREFPLCKAVVIEVNVTGCAEDNAANINLEGVKVELVDANTGNLVKSLYTNSSGKVIFKDIVSGSYYYKVSKSGYISNENTSATCTYTSESSNCDREFPLCKAVVIEINVTGCAEDNAANVNLENARVDLIDFFTGNIVQTKYSNTSGKVIFKDAIAGTYYFKVTKLGYISNENKSACTYALALSDCDREFPLCKACLMNINITDNASNLIENAQVKLFAENGTLITLRYTNANGTVEISGIPTGNYYANATKSGYTTASSINDLQIYSEETCGDIVLKISLKETIEVCVNDTNNNSLQGVKVDLIKVSDNQIEKTLSTNTTTGCTVFNDISDNNYYINVSKLGYVSDKSDTFTYSETKGYFKPFQLLEKPKIYGKVTDEKTNQTIKGVLVQLCDLAGTCIMNTTTDINRTYKLVELPETGQYKLVFSKFEYNTEEIDSVDGNPINLNGLTSYEINISLASKPNIEGYVDTNTTTIIKYLEGVTVQLDRNCNDIADNVTTTDTNGYYVFVAPVSGDYKLKFIKRGYLTGESNCTNFNAFNPLEINISLDKAPSIDGYVTDQNNRTMRGAVVTLDKDCDGTIENTTTTDAYGYYIFESQEAPPSGVKYCINAEKTGYISPEMPYNISFSNAPYEVNLSLTTKPSIYGYVTEEDNITLIAGANVVLDKGCNGEDTTDIYQLTDTSGYFVFEQPLPDQYCIYVSKSGYVSNELLPPEMPFFNGTSEIEVSISLAKSAAKAKISGHIYDNETNTLIQNVLVELYANCTTTSNFVNSTYTDSNGYYEFTPQPGNYCIKVSKLGYNSVEKNFATDVTFGTFNGKYDFVYDFKLVKFIAPYIEVCVYEQNATPFKPLSDVLVEIYSGSNVISSNNTNTNGCIKFFNISVGNYTIKAAKSGYLSNNFSAYYPGTNIEYEINLTTLGYMKICVVDGMDNKTPIAVAEVNISAFGITKSNFTGNDGCVLFTNISKANYEISIGHEHYETTTGNHLYNEGDIVEINISLVGKACNTTNITGRIVQNGSPVAGVNVTISDNNTIINTTITGSDGKYMFIVQNPGNYTMSIISENYIAFELNLQIPKGLCSFSIPETNTMVTLMQKPNCSALIANATILYGYVVDASDGSGINGSAVVAEYMNYTGGLGSSAVTLTSKPNTITTDSGYFEMLVPYGSYNLSASLSGASLAMQKNYSKFINVSVASECSIYVGKIYLIKEVEASRNAEITKICSGNITQEIKVIATTNLINANLTLRYPGGSTQTFLMDCDKNCIRKLSVQNAVEGNYSYEIYGIVDIFGNKYPDVNGTYAVVIKIPEISIVSQLLEGNNMSADIIIISENNISNISVEILDANNQILNVSVFVYNSTGGEKKYVATFNTKNLSTYVIQVNVTDLCGNKASKSMLVRSAEVYPQSVSFCGEGNCFSKMGSGYELDNEQRNDMFSTIFFKNSSTLMNLPDIMGKNVTDDITRVWREARSVVNYNGLYYTAYEEWQNDIPKVYIKAYNPVTNTATKYLVEGLSDANIRSYKPYLYYNGYWYLAYLSNESDAMGGAYIAKYTINRNSFSKEERLSYIGVGTDVPVVTVCGNDYKVYVAYQLSNNIYVKIYNFNLEFLEEKNITNFTDVFSAEAPSILCDGNTINLAYQVNKKLPEIKRTEWESNFYDVDGKPIWAYMLSNKTENRIFIDKYDINMNSATGSNNATIEIIDKKGSDGISATTLPYIFAEGSNKYVVFLMNGDLY